MCCSLFWERQYSESLYIGWAFLEQLALAAIDVGRLDVADVCKFRLVC